MSIRSFSQYITEDTKSVYLAWGRFNPPTIGHEKLLKKLAKSAGSNQFFILASQSTDPKKNPLPFPDKIKMLRKMFPKYGRNILLHKYRTLFDVMTDMYNKGYNEVNLLAGSDRVNEYDALLKKYNGTKGRHGFYNFQSINIISAGERDPDAEGASGMSASKLRAAAADNDFATFMKGMPSGFKDAQTLFNMVRKGMGLQESTDFRTQVKFDPVSEQRESYIRGEIFNVTDLIVVKESEEIGQVIMRGSNYVLVEMADGRKLRKWLTDIEIITEKEDPDIGDQDGSQPANYYKGIKTKSTKQKRAAQFKKQAAMDDDDPNAYKPAPGDASAETKPSKHTKAFQKKFGEGMMSFSSFNEVIIEGKTEDALRKKADQSGMPYAILKKVFDRGVAAWRTGHRPGTTAVQWGLARVNSFATKSKGTWGKADADLAAKVRGE